LAEWFLKRLSDANVSLNLQLDALMVATDLACHWLVQSMCRFLFFFGVNKKKAEHWWI